MAIDTNLAKFALDDLFRLAVTIEQGGYDFYSHIMDDVRNPRIKNEIRFLRDEEAKHRIFFQEQLNKRGKPAAGAFSAELNAILEKEFLTPMEEIYRTKNSENNQDALRFGIELEQKSIDFYTAMRQGQTNVDLLADLDIIILEERAHKRKLSILTSY
jgi:rubrerythrin